MGEDRVVQGVDSVCTLKQITSAASDVNYVLAKWIYDKIQQLWFEVYSPPLTATSSYLVLHTFSTHCGLSFTETGDKPYSCTNVRLIPNFICIPVFDAYMKLSGYEIEESIKRETSGNLKDLLLAVGMCSRRLPEVILLSLAPQKWRLYFNPGKRTQQ